MATIEKNIRKDLGRSGVESNASRINKDRSHSLEDFYVSEPLDFEMISKLGNKKIKQIVQKDLVYVKDPSDLIMHICDERNIILQEAMVRIGIDGGQSSLKVVMNIFDPNEPEAVGSDNQKYTGVNKMIVLALVRDVQETYSNLELIFEKSKLRDLKFKLACDLKVLNIILGLSAHGGKHACLYCDGTINQPGGLRTIANLKSSHESYLCSGGDKRKMSQFGNVVNKCLLEEKEDVPILDIIPISELHHLMKVVTKLSELLTADDGLKRLYKDLGIHWHGYNGGGLDGKNSSKVLKSLNTIRDYVITNKMLKFIPVIDALVSFSDVVQSCFGMQLDSEYRRKIEHFNDRISELEINQRSDNLNFSMGWKGHNLKFHLADQLDLMKMPLGIYSEQTSEAAHRSMKKTLSRYTTSEEKSCHGESLRRVTSTYSSMRV